MADDKKSDSSQTPSPTSPDPPEAVDDWDSLPLDPDGDDWDDIPPPRADNPANPESTSPPIPAAPIPAAAAPPLPPNLPSGAAPPPDSGQIFALLGADDEFKVDDFGDQFLEAESDPDEPGPLGDDLDELDLPDSLDSSEPPAPDGAATEAPADGLNFDDLLSAAPEAESVSADADDWSEAAGAEDAGEQGGTDPGGEADVSAPALGPAVDDAPGISGASEARPASAGSGEEDSEDAHFDAAGFLDGAVEPAGGDEPEEDREAVSVMDKIEAELEDLPTKKVELDIEGIFLEDHDPPPAEEEAPSPETEPQEEPAPQTEVPSEPEEIPASKKVPKIKLLMLLVPALLLVGGLGFGLYKLFFSSPAAESGPAPLVIDPNVPLREPQPGSLDLGAFYVNFPGERGETIMEMTVVLYYKDLPNRAAIEARLPLIRDIIYLASQGQGSQVISNGEAQRQLRQVAAEQANAALGGNHIDYVQISQIRILQ